MLAQHTWKYRVRWAIRTIAGDTTFRRADAIRRWHHYRRAGVVFIHIPKAAGSTVATWLYGQRLGHHRGVELMRERPQEWERLHKISVLRDPLERLHSAHSYIFSGGTQEGAVRWRREYDDPQLRDINLFVKTYLTSGPLSEKDPVLQPQSWFVCDNSGTLIQGIDCYPIHGLGQLFSDFGASDRPAPPKKTNAQRVAQFQRLDNEARSIVEHLYARDLEIWKFIQADGVVS